MRHRGQLGRPPPTLNGQKEPTMTTTIWIDHPQALVTDVSDAATTDRRADRPRVDPNPRSSSTPASSMPSSIHRVSR